MRNLHLASGAALVAFAFLALGSGKSSGTAAGGDGASTTSAAADPAESKPTLIGRCNNPKDGTCDEYYNMIPTLVPDLCKNEGGEFKKGADECPKASLLGICHYKKTSSDGPGQFHYIYTNNSMSAEAAKKDCVEGYNEDKHKVWTDAPAAPKASAAASATGASSGAVGTTTATATAKTTAATTATAKATATAAATTSAKPAASGSKPVAK